ncbi:MAG: cyaA 2 [Chloroflexi bacterium]|nr:cyaA 2 [Chloroflexota bacterium]
MTAARLFSFAPGPSLLTRSIAGKIVIPYLILVFLLAMLGTYVTVNLIVGSLEQRVQQDLASSGRAANEAMVVLETDQLNLLRQMAFTVGVDDALAARDTDALLRLLSPLAATSDAAYVDVFAPNGQQILALRSPRLGPTAGDRVDPAASSWSPVARVLAGSRDRLGDRFTSAIPSPWGGLLVTASPVDHDGMLVGAISVAIPADEVAARLSREGGAKGITLYSTDGVVGTTLKASPSTRSQALAIDPASRDAIDNGDRIVVRRVAMDGLPYIEILGPLAVRQELGLILGVGNLGSLLDDPSADTRNAMLWLFSLVIVAVLAIGLWLAARISGPLRALVDATARVVRNDLEFQVPVQSRDETGVLTAAFNEMTAGLRERERSRVAIEKYMSPKVYRLIQDGELKKMGGSRREITVLKTDIRGFTTRAEAMDPEELVEFLNRYFERIVAKVSKYDGEVDKYMGDSILAKFGATQWYPDHARQAALAMVEMIEACDLLNEELVAEGHAAIKMGIGVNTGTAVVGNLGSPERMEYTIISDAVNTAQRIEDLCSELGWDLLMSEATYAEAEDAIAVGMPWEVQLRGQSRQTLVYPVLGRKGEVPSHRLRAYQALQLRSTVTNDRLALQVTPN